MPTISVIVPVYNSAKYLKSCLDSILNQTFTDFELILINDGSTDDSRLICEKYLKSDNRIKLFNQDNSGQAAARNKGIKESAGEWLCFVDSDDCVNPWMLEYLYKAAADSLANMSICNYIQGDNLDSGFFNKLDYSYIGYDVSEQTTINLLKTIPSVYLLVCTKLIKKEIVLSNLFAEGRIYEDNAVAPKWLYESKRISVVNLPLYFYTKNNKGTTESKFSIKKLDLLWSTEEQMDFLKHIAFFILEKMILMDYINYCYSLSAKVKNQLGLKKLSKTVLRNGRKIVRKHKNTRIMSCQEKKIVNDFLHPTLTRMKNKKFIR